MRHSGAALLAFLVALGWSVPAFCDEIHDAAKNGDLAKVQELLKKNPSLASSKDNYGLTPLHWAAVNGNKALAELLLANKAEVNATNASGATPLHAAAMTGHETVAELLLANKAEVNAKNYDGLTPLYLAAMEGHKAVAERLLANKAEVNARDSKYGASPLYVAAAKGHRDLVELLLKNKADANAKANNGTTPLHAAAEHGFRDIVELLLANGADVRARGNQGAAPLDLAAAQGHKDVVELLHQHGAQEATAGVSAAAPAGAGATPAPAAILVAAQSGDLMKLKALLKDSPDLVLSRDKNGATPLHLAGGYGHKDLVELLLASKAEVNAKDNSGTTPLYFAALYGHADVAKLLIANKADVNARDSHGQTPLHGASLMGHRDVAELLLVHHADINARADNGTTPLHAAAAGQFLLGNKSEASKEQIELIRLLLANKADPSLEDHYNASPLGFALLAGNLAAAREIANALRYEILSVADDRVITGKDWQEVFHCRDLCEVGMSLNVGSPPVMMMISSSGHMSGNLRPTGFEGVVKIGEVLLRGTCEYVYAAGGDSLSGIRVKRGALIAYPSRATRSEAGAKE
jgi:ankyrin repeat protein